MARTKVFIVCSGLGHINRGYESFFRGCFDALVSEADLDLTLYKGAGAQAAHEIRLPNLCRGSRSAKILGKLLGRSDYFAEQLTFFLSLLPRLLARRPDVVYVSDVVLGNFLRLAQKLPLFSYKVLFNNNGPVLPTLLHRWDHIQQVSPQYLNDALAAGVPREKQTLLPSAVDIPKSLPPHGDPGALRDALGLPRDRPIVLSVGAIDGGRKRMDYLVQEMAKLPVPRPFLLLLGQKTSDSPRIIELGEDLLSMDGFDARTVAKDEVSDYYRAASIFALASVDEGFGLAYVEAMSYGLPCLVHDYETSRFVLGDMGTYGDLTQPGTLMELLSDSVRVAAAPSVATARHAGVYDRFSWDRLTPAYVELFQQCAASRS